MKPIQDIINEIKWSKHKNLEDFTLGYYDRIQDVIIEIPFASIKKIEEGFMVIDKDLEEVSIPLHRIRIVKEQGKIIWQR